MNEDRRPRPVVAVLFLGGALLAAMSVFAGWPGLGQLGRWVAIAGVCAYALRRRSLTTWILVSMVVGAEIGHDWPGGRRQRCAC